MVGSLATGNVWKEKKLVTRIMSYCPFGIFAWIFSVNNNCYYIIVNQNSKLRFQIKLYYLSYLLLKNFLQNDIFFWV